ncbi:DUF2059 domain-containing protein [Motilimonas pumila]|uniref:DUF2059 domain-containing protein n=1 Tax=Motilimonas pumila TaxID=2303987 RepID=A0A418YGZ8_9GAMM|nr:DUF2059 domain-containing protein [Motilimonas pumila]RJG49097.1 DUF2059 domain-containing protein [Motilimonas pumila]
MKALYWLFFCLCFSGKALASVESEAEKLLNTVGMEQAMEQSIATMLDLQMQQNPALAPYKETMLAFFEKHMSFDSLKPDLIALYIEMFTEQELKQINQFYSTEAGKKAIRVMPELMQKGAMIGAQRVQTHQGELIEMMQKKEAELIQAQ